MKQKVKATNNSPTPYSPLKVITTWKQLRVPLLAITFSSAILVLGKLVIFPVSDKLTFSSLIFPEKVPLPQWQFSESRPLPAPVEKTPELITQKRPGKIR